MRKSELMSQPVTQHTGYAFDDFYLDVANRRLLRAGQPVPLNSKYFDVLLALVSRSGQLVEKQRIFEEVWDGLFVTDGALTQCIKDVRRQLGDDASNPRYIKTIPKHGYMFIASVAETGSVQVSRGAAPSGQVTSSRPRPYKFLDYYTERDARLFFGRESEVEAVCSQVLAHRSVILHGRSGVGKSSILRAGLTPTLKARGHHVFLIRSFTDPVHQMTRALAGVVLYADQAPHPITDTQHATHDTESGTTELIHRLASTAPGSLVIFLLDQFEEFFSLLDEDATERFIETLAGVSSIESSPVRFVFTLREDLLAEMSRLKLAIPEIFHHEYRLTRFSREQAARVITEPARAVGCQYEDRLVERLVDDLSDHGSVDPPQLQIVCDNLYDARDADGRLTLEAYEGLGAARQILAGYLDRVLHRFRAADLHVVKSILTALISADGQRLVLRASELYSRATGREATNLAEELTEELVRARVVRGRRQDGETWFELAHDVLTAEVSRWLSADELALKRARAVIGRAMENYRAHELIVDSDALELVLPFGEELGLTSEEADLLAASALHRGRSLPEWLVHKSPSISTLIERAAKQTAAEVRLCAIEACALLRDSASESLLRRLALWDRELAVRKAASIALADWFPTSAETVLSTPGGEIGRPGLIRLAVSLAIVRDDDRRRVRLTRLPVLVSLLVVGGLMWVRLRRSVSEITRLGIGGTLGGAVSGMVGGLLLGATLASARSGTLFESASLMIVLVSLGAFIGGVGAFGVSFGMAAASEVAYRHSRWWAVVGGASGGAIVGGSTKFLGVDTVRALFGQSPTGITGALEGAMIGAGVSLGALLIATLRRHSRPWQRVAGASVGAMIAGIVLTIIGGNLFSGSLEIVARSFANSQIHLDPLALFFGEVHFGHTTQVILGAIEGLMFGAGTMSGVEASAHAVRGRQNAAVEVARVQA